MSRQRAHIPKALLFDPAYVKLSPAARLVLLVYPLLERSRSHGVVVADPAFWRMLAEGTGLPEDECKRCMDELIETGWVEREGWMLWLKPQALWTSHNLLANWSSRRRLVKELDPLPNSGMVLRFCREYDIPLPPRHEYLDVPDGPENATDLPPIGPMDYEPLKLEAKTPPAVEPPQILQSARAIVRPNKRVPYKRICAHFRWVCGRSCNEKDSAVRRTIRNRFFDGYGVLDFFHVHVIAAYRFRGTMWQVYLRPDYLWNAKRFQRFRNLRFDEVVPAQGGVSPHPTVLRAMEHLKRLQAYAASQR